MYSDEFLARMRDKLLNEKQEVIKKIEIYSQDEEPMDNPDLDDLGNDAVEDIIEEKVIEAHKQILTKIDAALERMNKGTYGLCDETQEYIPENLLEKVPWAHTCKNQK